ncbi:phage tail tape measure protein, TP901 family, core region [Klenkia marina]|uniref:Phage tail tape measure protein, TP901 family, core region n=1 Tax=Klenkia marina TaxID=1960309 RepID=A0A1G4X9R1_9ACTN|nr:phage tail tape measure protein [Klenkia marina]SCX37970.1 phage tail tape measure protein, TP901 family, core region [Klenkia marina]
MANRTVSVAIRADIAQYMAGMRAAAAQTTQFGSLVDLHSKKSRAGLETIGMGATLVGGAMVAGFGLAVAKAAEFDKAMSAVGAASMASAVQLGQLRQAALDAGADTAYSATEAANAMTELSKAGVSTSDILSGGLDGALSLAAAGQLEVADAAEIAATALSVFGLSGSQMNHVADLLAAGAGKAQGSVDDLSQAMNQSALVAKNAGLSIDQTTGALALFASQGLLGSDAGTSFKTMLMSLNPRSQEAADLMDQLGLRAYDAQGQFVGLQEYAGQLQTGLSGLSQEQRNSALQTIFGTDAIRAATILYDAGSQGVAEWTRNVNDQGYAAEQAAKLTDNLAGDIERLGGAFDTALIQSGSSANGVLRFLVQTATGAVDTFSELPGPLQGAATGVLGVAGAGTLALGVVGSLIPRVAEARDTLRDMGDAGIRVDRGLGAFGRFAAKAGAAGVAIGLLSAAYDAMHPPAELVIADTEELQRALEGLAQTGVADGALRDIFGAGLRGLVDDMNATLPQVTSGIDSMLYQFELLDDRGSFDLGQLFTFEDRGDNLQAMRDEFAQAQQNVADLDDALAAMVGNGNAEAAANATMQLYNAWVRSGGEIGEFRRRFPDAVAAMEGYVETSTTVVDETGAITGAMGEAKSASDLLKQSFDALNGIYLTAAEANVQWTQAMADLSIAAENGSTSLDLNSAAGADNAEQFINAATQARDWAAAVGDVSGPEAGRAKLAELRDALINNAVATGFNRDEVTNLINELFRVPSDVQSAAALVDNATPGINAVNAALDQINGRTATTYVNTVVTQTINRILGASPSSEAGLGSSGLVGVPDVPGRASGGPVSAGRTYLVGEEGPELVRFAQAGMVFNAPKTRALLAGGGTGFAAGFAAPSTGFTSTSREVSMLSSSSWSSQETSAAGMRSREFSGSSVGGGSAVFQGGDTNVQVFIDGQEFRGIARVVADQAVNEGFGSLKRNMMNRGVRA